MSAALTHAHPFTRDEEIAGQRQAENFLRRIAAGEPMHIDDLGQQFEMARSSSLARARAFAARVQLALQESGNAAE